VFDPLKHCAFLWPVSGVLKPKQAFGLGLKSESNNNSDNQAVQGPTRPEDMWISAPPENATRYCPGTCRHGRKVCLRSYGTPYSM